MNSGRINNKGLTLIEIMVALAIVGLMVGMSLSIFDLRPQRYRGFINDMQQVMESGRDYAMRNQRNVIVHFTLEDDIWHGRAFVDVDGDLAYEPPDPSPLTEDDILIAQFPEVNERYPENYEGMAVTVAGNRVFFNAQGFSLEDENPTSAPTSRDIDFTDGADHLEGQHKQTRLQLAAGGSMRWQKLYTVVE